MNYLTLSEKAIMEVAKRARVAEYSFDFSKLLEDVQLHILGYFAYADRAKFGIVIRDLRFNHILKVRHFINVCGISRSQPFINEIIHFAKRHELQNRNLYCVFCDPRRLLGLSQFQKNAIREICLGQGIESTFNNFKGTNPPANPFNPSTCGALESTFIASKNFFENFGNKLFPFRVRSAVDLMNIYSNRGTHVALEMHSPGIVSDIRGIYMSNNRNWDIVFTELFSSYTGYNGIWLCEDT